MRKSWQKRDRGHCTRRRKIKSTKDNKNPKWLRCWRGLHRKSLQNPPQVRNVLILWMWQLDINFYFLFQPEPFLLTEFLTFLFIKLILSNQEYLPPSFHHLCALFYPIIWSCRSQEVKVRVIMLRKKAYPVTWFLLPILYYFTFLNFMICPCFMFILCFFSVIKPRRIKVWAQGALKSKSKDGEMSCLAFEHP